MKNGDDVLVFEKVKIEPSDLKVLENVIEKHLRGVMAQYQSGHHDDLVIAGLTRIMMQFGRNIVTPRFEDREGYDVQFIDHKKTPS